MSEKVKLSKDGSSIDFVAAESLPTSVKKFRQSPEMEGFYRFIFENDLQKEAFEILERIVSSRKIRKAADRAAAKQKDKEEALKVKEAAKALKEEPKKLSKDNEKMTPTKKASEKVKMVSQPTKIAKPVMKKPAGKAKLAPAKASAKNKKK